jgi:hypothetical protein
MQIAAPVPSLALAVPASLHASLMARLDRLGPAKEVAQIRAAIGREFSHALLVALVRKPELELNSALGRLIDAGLLFRQRTPPHATYLFKHALVQDTAYGTLLRDARRALHARIAETLEAQFAEMAETRPELLAQIASLTATPTLRREQIKCQVGIANALYHAKGMTTTETRAAFDRARVMIEQAERLGEHIEDPLLLYSVLYGFFIAKFLNFDGDAACALARQFLDLADQQEATAPIMIGHRLLGTTLLCMGDAAEALSHLDRALSFHDSAAHRALATRFGHDVRVAILAFQPLALWLLGYPDRALLETQRALHAAREAGHIPTLMFALSCSALTHICSRDHAAAAVQLEECVALAEEKSVHEEFRHW